MTGIRTGIDELERLLREGRPMHLRPDGEVILSGYDRKDADSYGHKLVGFSFNPSGDPKVAQLKGLFAEIIDICHDGLKEAGDNEAATIWNEAVLRSLDAQMWSVKAATWPKAK